MKKKLIWSIERDLTRIPHAMAVSGPYTIKFDNEIHRYITYFNGKNIGEFEDINIAKDYADHHNNEKKVK